MATKQKNGKSGGTSIVLATDGEALGEALKKTRGTLKSLLGSEDMAVRAFKVAYVLVRRTPDLQQCTIESIVNGMLQSAQFGLELGSEAYLVPFYNKDIGMKEAAWIADWKGLARLAERVGSLTGSGGDLVYKNDEYFCRRTGDSVEFAHQRERFGKRAEKDMVAAHREAGCQGVYFIGYKPSGPPVVAEMSVSDVEYVRATYSKMPDSPLWTKRWSAGAIKTAAKQALKTVRMTPELQAALELDNRIETGIESAVIDGDEDTYTPYAEPKPIAAGKAEVTDAETRQEDLGFAK